MVRPDDNPVTGAPVSTDMTTLQAADLLNVSRPYLIELLDDGQIPCQGVGDRRTVKRADILEYKCRDDARRTALLDELTREAERVGLEY